MGKLTNILHAAQLRSQASGLPYKGALSPIEAYEVLQLAPGFRLVDVRTRAECDWVGRIPGAIEIEWAHYPGMQRNPHFDAQLGQVVEKEALVLFLCRSGHRSHTAAAYATQLGYADCYNILEGFEGDKNATGQRRCTNGWCFAGLPWQQG